MIHLKVILELSREAKALYIYHLALHIPYLCSTSLSDNSSDDDVHYTLTSRDLSCESIMIEGINCALQ